jgi:hypothetical protein
MSEQKYVWAICDDEHAVLSLWDSKEAATQELENSDDYMSTDRICQFALHTKEDAASCK